VEATDRQTGERFAAIVDFSRAGGRLPAFSSHDPVVEAERTRMKRPSWDVAAHVLTVTGVVGTVPAAPR
jgi:hypothetical protein